MSEQPNPPPVVAANEMTWPRVLAALVLCAVIIAAAVAYERLG